MCESKPITRVCPLIATVPGAGSIATVAGTHTDKADHTDQADHVDKVGRPNDRLIRKSLN